MKAYMGYDGVAGPSEAAILIFAHTVKEGKKISFGTLQSLFDCEFVDMRVRLLKEEHLFKEADQEKLKAGIPHVIESPKVCGNCEVWGGYPVENGQCCFCETGEE